VTQKSATARLKDAKADGDDESVGALSTMLELLKRETTAKKAAKDAQAALARIMQ
jgi:hypothetical protein